MVVCALQRDTEVKKHVEEILDILVYIHGQKLAHNDMKVENLLLFMGHLHFHLKAGDWDSARTFGEPRAKQATPCASLRPLAPRPLPEPRSLLTEPAARRGAQTSALRS